MKNDDVIDWLFAQRVNHSNVVRLYDHKVHHLACKDLFHSIFVHQKTENILFLVLEVRHL